MGKRESVFQREVKKEIQERLPGCIVTKMDAGQIQGIPDLLILHNDRWGTLECKRSPNENIQPNQEYYVDKMNQMSFSAFIHPGNKEDILDELQRTLESKR